MEPLWPGRTGSIPIKKKWKGSDPGNLGFCPGKSIRFRNMSSKNETEHDQQKLNVIVFCTDQQHWNSVGFNGNQFIKTPNLDRLADSGVIFENHITTSMLCMPARASIITGLYPRNHKLWNHYYNYYEAKLTSLPRLFSQNGWRSHSAGKIHLTKWFDVYGPCHPPEYMEFWQDPSSADWNGPYCGYDTVDLVLWHGWGCAAFGGHYGLEASRKKLLRDYAPDGRLDRLEDALVCEPDGLDILDAWPMKNLPEGEHYNDWIASKSIQFIQENKDDPFFLHVSFPDPHVPFTAATPHCNREYPEWKTILNRREGELEDMPDLYMKASNRPGSSGRVSEDSLRGKTFQYYAMVEHVDDCIGRVVDEVYERGIQDRTVFVFLSDHGEMLGNHWLLRKSFYGYRDLTRVPFFIAGEPVRALRKTGRISEVTSHVDLMPTLAGLCGLECPAVDGEDLTGLIAGDKTSLSRSGVLAELQVTQNPESYAQHFFSGPWRFSRYPNKPGVYELFDLKADPFEQANLAKDELPEIGHKLKALLDELFPPIDEANDILPFYEDYYEYPALQAAVVDGLWPGQNQDKIFPAPEVMLTTLRSEIAAFAPGSQPNR
jgi:arylsulfatase